MLSLYLIVNMYMSVVLKRGQKSKDWTSRGAKKGAPTLFHCGVQSSGTASVK